MIREVFSVFVLLVGLSAIVSLSGCYYDVEEELYPDSQNPQTCDTSNVRYAVEVKTILDARCNSTSCHGGVSAPSGIRLDNYADIKTYIDQIGSRLLSSIEQNGNASSMPQGQPRIPDCDINQIRIWINSGYPEN
ncbi:MAG: hypothetical protein WED33_05940 [Bacteroidia bacterium]